MPSPTLEHLFQTFLATGDEAALGQFLRRSAPQLRRLARRLGVQAEDAEDLVQETLVAAIQGADRYDAARPLLPWLKGILTFRAAKLARDGLRRRRLWNDAADAAPVPVSAEQPEAAVRGRELDASVRDAIDDLPEEYRAPLRQYLFAGRSPVEIAHGLGLQRATVRVQLHRGLRRLREALVRWVSLAFLLLLGRQARAAGAPPRAVGTAAAWLLVATCAGCLAYALLPTTTSQATLDLSGTSGLVAHAPSGSRLGHEAALAAPNAPVAERSPVAVATGLTVLVHDDAGDPVAGVGLSLVPAHGRDPVLHRRTGVTDHHGRMHWPQPGEGAFQVESDRGPRVSVAVVAGANELAMPLPRGRTLAGKVVDADGNPVAGADVWLAADPEGPWRGADVAVSDADGCFVLSHVPDGACLAARHDRFAGSDVVRVAGTAPISGVALRLGPPGGTVQVQVLDPHGSPCARALVFVGESADAAPLALAQGATAWRPPPYERRTDASGRAATKALLPARHPVFVRAPGCEPFVGHVSVVADTATRLVVRLVTGGRLSGRVTGASGQPVAGAQVVFRTDGLGNGVDLHADLDGRFQFECVPIGRAEVAARAPGFAPCLRSVDVAAVGTPDVALVLPAVRAVHGVLHAADGVDVESALVRATWPPSSLRAWQRITSVGPDGVFEFAAELAGRPTLSVRLAGEPLWRSVDSCSVWVGDEARVLLPAAFAADAWLAGAAHCDDGTPVAAARVFVCRDGVEWAEVGRTDEHGAFRVGPLPAASYDLFFETTNPELPTAMAGPFVLHDGEERHVAHRTPTTGGVEVEFVRTDGAPIGDLVVTLVGCAPQRRIALGEGANFRQRLVPGDYRLFAMGGHVQWLEAMPIRIEAGAIARHRVLLRPATRYELLPCGLPPPPDEAPRNVVIRDRTGPWSSSFTWLADAPERLAVVLPTGDYELEHVERSGTAWFGSFTVNAEVVPSRGLAVQMAPR